MKIKCKHCGGILDLPIMSAVDQMYKSMGDHRVIIPIEDPVEEKK